MSCSTFKRMKTHVNLILALMALCVSGIIGLQLFWNYQNYTSALNTFQYDINQAMTKAVDLERAQRHQQLIRHVKHWLADTSFIRITCDIQSRDSNTVFHINDRYPKFAGSSGLSFGLTNFKRKLSQITPEAKKLVINHFAETRLLKDLQEGFIYYYTQRLGDSLTKAYTNSHLRMKALDTLYRQQLASKGIHSSFRFQTDAGSPTGYVTEPVNAALARPYKQEMVQARLTRPDSYLLSTMKWAVMTTLLLATICLVCFGYTAKVLLSQHKLTVLKDDFINNMTHELNTPLASIKITAEALKSFHYSPDVQKEYLDIISYQTEKLTELTTQILTANRHLVATKEDWQPVDLNPLIHQAIDALWVQSRNQQATVTFHSAAEPALIYGQAANLLTAFTNIIDNALKYSSSVPHLRITLIVDFKWAEIVFADNGIGIPEAYRNKLFDPFFRVPQGNVHTIKGYGLGLSYVRQSVGQHRGLVTVEANQPCGSLFRIKLPLV